MEFPDLGKQCSDINCKQLDFVPFKCQCSKYFCRNHFLHHCLSECESHKKIGVKQNIDHDSVIHYCTNEDCKSASIVELLCEKCNKHYCINHRFHDSCYDLKSDLSANQAIEEEDIRNEEIREKIEREVTLRLRNAENTPKAKTALKIQLMKLKSKAVGEKNIPVLDRIYFSVKKPANLCPKALTEKPKEITIDSSINIDGINRKAVYISKNWTIGRCIDSFSNHCGIKNENHVGKAPKLRIFRETDGMCICLKKQDRTINSLIEEKCLIDGEKILLEYLSEENIIILNENCVYFLQEKLEN